MTTEEKYMKRCVELASLGSGYTSPNPLVGAVIVHGGKIIGEGYHQQYGSAHAEVNAIESVFIRFSNPEMLLKEAQLYVNLEPCAHFGKTPPCANLIINNKIPTVFIGSADPFKHVNGKGIQRLTEAGVSVYTSIMEKKCDALNKRFFTYVKKQRPFIILKWAQTADAYFAPVDRSQRWITGYLSKVLTHKWRTLEDAVLVGTRTALSDNPQLNARLYNGRNPVRVVLDEHLSIPVSNHIYNDACQTLIFNSIKSGKERNVVFIQLESFSYYVPQMIAYQLYLMDIQSVIIEGGIKTINMFLKENLWDEARILQSSVLWGDGIKAPLMSSSICETFAIGSDSLTIYKNL